MRDHELTRPPLPEPVGLRALRDRILLMLLRTAVGSNLDGRVTIQLPSGHAGTIGSSGGVHADLKLASFHVLWQSLRRGTLGFAEAYLDKAIETSDLGNIFRFFIANRNKLDRAGGGVFRVRKSDRAYHAGRDNTREGSRRNIAAHYDLGNDFYAAWLDPGMAYSSGVFLAPDMTLEDAQAEKYRSVMRAMDLAAGDRVLEIGCGWGGFVEAAARAGAHVDAITVSERQLDYTRRRIAAAGLGDRASARFLDYRDVTGAYDRIASIEMIEAVGEAHWPTYFKTLHERLRPGGVAAVQAITIREDSYEGYRARPDFIQRYIFPGGMLPTPSLIRSHAEAAGLKASCALTFGSSYARTLRAWRQRFHEQWPQIAAMGFDDRFRRLWHYYLTYCEIGFEMGVIDVGIYRFQRRMDA